MAKSTEQGQVVENVEVQEVVTIDPFAGDDTEPTVYVKLEDRRQVAIEVARELLGDEADTATPEEAILALRQAGHEFYRAMKSSPRQTRRFKRGFVATQPQGAKRSARIAKSAGIKEDLAAARDLLSQVRTNEDAQSTKEQLEAVKALADEMLSKIG